MTGYELDNAEARNRKHPKTFEIPPRAERDNLHTGDLAKLIFTDPDGGGERMWVHVEGRTDDGQYRGRLGNDPVVMDLQAGDLVRFGPEHVIEIMTAEEMERLVDEMDRAAEAH